MPNNYQNVVAFIFAIEEIHRNPDLLPNVSLGYDYHNLLYSYWKLLESVLMLYTGQKETPNYSCGRETKSIALLTGSPWVISSQIGPLLELYKFPQDCTPNASLAWLPVNHFDTAMSEGSYNTYNAVYSVAHAHQEMLVQQNQALLMGNGGTMVFSPWQLHPFLKNLWLKNSTGELGNLDMKNKMDEKYDILNLWNFPEGLRLRVKIGGFSPHAPLGQQLSVSEEVMEWAAGITEITAPGRRMRQLLVSGAPLYIIPICSLIQLTLCEIWMGTNPPYIGTDAHSEHGHIIIVCSKGSLTAFYCVLGYLGSLALVSFTVAFLARNLSETFNEAKFLTFSMPVFCSVWITFLPVYHSTKGKVMVAMEVFSILASSAGLLGCSFGPKCYNILLRPERNSLHGFRHKAHPGRKKPS
ncbi:Vomeronasal type-2 receptor 26 [Heterocephalus glaber]|uniref:Vomeronasal type-2 receptor 26 n=1 Tax=Heterocephalus glaber TaxID=10181 RepID=G5B9J2_HETGA|nr:Vomeronasal type-2 receptor 26 [Heterocephalus glaber]